MGSGSSKLPFMIERSTLPDGWISNIDTKTNSLIFIQVKTGVQQPNHPRGLKQTVMELHRYSKILLRLRRVFNHPRYKNHTQYSALYNYLEGMGTGSKFAEKVNNGAVTAVLLEEAMAKIYDPMPPIGRKKHLKKGTSESCDRVTGGWGDIGYSNNLWISNAVQSSSDNCTGLQPAHKHHHHHHHHSSNAVQGLSDNSASLQPAHHHHHHSSNSHHHNSSSHHDHGHSHSSWGGGDSHSHSHSSHHGGSSWADSSSWGGGGGDSGGSGGGDSGGGGGDSGGGGSWD